MTHGARRKQQEHKHGARQTQYAITDSTIKSDPNYDVYVDTADGKQIMLFFISVAHEMIHILKYMGGYRKTEYISDNNARQEELETVGISFQDNNGNFVDANN